MASSYSFIIAGIAIWRITHMLHIEMGPGDILEKIRNLAKRTFFGKAMECFYCLSVWIAGPFALFVGESLKERLLLWPALSGVAILLERITTKAPAQARYFEDPPVNLTEGNSDVQLHQ